MIDPEALPDPGVVTGLEANKLPSDPLCQVASWSRWKFHFFLWEVEEDGEKMRSFAVWYSGDALDALVKQIRETRQGHRGSGSESDG